MFNGKRKNPLWQMPKGMGVQTSKLSAWVIPDTLTHPASELHKHCNHDTYKLPNHPQSKNKNHGLLPACSLCIAAQGYA